MCSELGSVASLLFGTYALWGAIPDENYVLQEVKTSCALIYKACCVEDQGAIKSGLKGLKGKKEEASGTIQFFQAIYTASYSPRRS